MKHLAWILCSLSALCTGATDVHDPHIIKDKDTYYIFSTGRMRRVISVIESKDLLSWTRSADVFTAVPDWIKKEIPACRELWASDVHKIGDRFCLYYSASTFGSQRSFIGLATNKTLDPNSPDFKWVDQGMVIESKPGMDFNAIDAGVLTDADGRVWLTWGSFWGGIKLAELNPKTGKLLSDTPTIHSIARRKPPETAIEGAYLIYRHGFYYLFVSFDACCRGINSTYKIMVGRSKSPTGPYIDREGRPMAEGGGSLVLQTEGRWIGPGHNSVLCDGDDDFLVYHTYDAQNRGRPVLQIRPIEWTQDLWPTPGPILAPPTDPNSPPQSTNP